VLAGDDANIFTTLALGGTGAIAASGHVHTARLVALMQHVVRGELAAAQALWRPLLPLIEALFSEPNPGPIKALLAQQGWMQAELRAPMTSASAELTTKLAAISASVAASPR
jgi:4-hydroxy-tetrahydrodipicolinate synthase